MAMSKMQREYLKMKILTEDLGSLWGEDQIWLAPEEWEMPWEAVMRNKVYFRAMWGLDVAGGRELCLLQWDVCRGVRSWVRPELLMGWWGVSGLESCPLYFKRKFVSIHLSPCPPSSPGHTAPMEHCRGFLWTFLLHSAFALSAQLTCFSVLVKVEILPSLPSLLL